MKVIDIVIIAIVAVVLFFAIKSSLKHMKGEGGCCGGGEVVPEPDKKLTDPILGKVTFDVEGMTCMNCSNRIKRALNKLDGVSATVNLKKNKVTVAYSKEIETKELISVIENAGYKVVNY